MKTGQLIKKIESDAGDSIEIYAAADGEPGFVVGYRTFGSESLGLIGARRFDFLEHSRYENAMDYVAQLANDD